MELYEVSEMITELIVLSENVVDNIRKQYYWKTSYALIDLNRKLTHFFEGASGTFEQDINNNLLEIIKEIVAIQEDKDYVLIADIVELKLVPFLYELEMLLIGTGALEPADYFDENMGLLEDGSLRDSLIEWKCLYDADRTTKATLEYTNCGALTIKQLTNKGEVYLHSNKNPYIEAAKFALGYADKDICRYAVFGLGLAYHIEAMLDYDERYEVSCIETDIEIIGLAFTYRRLAKLLKSKRFSLCYSKDISAFIKSLGDTRFLIHYPSMMAISDDKIRESVQNYFIHLSTVYEQNEKLRANFHYNILRQDRCIDELKADFYGKCVVYIGGGPSAESKLKYIKELRDKEDIVVIAAGTVYRKLILKGFVPDYVTIIDPLPVMIKQLENIEATGAKLIYLATASKEAVGAFLGESFVAFQDGFLASELRAERLGYNIYETGGSVSTFAVDLALKLGCKKLITIGMDFGFPGNKTHGFSITEDSTPGSYGVYVEDLYGNQMETTKILNEYRKWVERRLESVTGVELINITEGAKIAHMKNVESYDDI